MVKASPLGPKARESLSSIKNGGKDTKAAQKQKLSTIDKQALQWIDNHLVDNPQLILLTKGYLEAGMVKDTSASKKEPDTFHYTYTTFKQIKKEFLAQVIVQVGKHHGLTTQVVDAVDACNKHAIRQMAAYFFGVEDGTRIPRPCLEKKVMWKFLFKRGDELGQRWKNFKGTILREDMSLNWQTHGCFNFEWQDEQVTLIKHVSGASVQEPPVKITPSWKLDSNYHDLLAGVSLGMISPRLREFFPDSEPTFAKYENSRLDQLAKDIQKDILEERLLTGSSSSDGVVLHTAKDKEKEKAKQRRPAPPIERLGVALVIPAAP